MEWSQPWLSSRPGLAAVYEGEGGPGASLSHCRALRKNGDPNSGLFSRPRLAVDEREHGLPLGIHLYLASLTDIFDCFAWWAGHDPHSATPQPSRLCRWWTAQWSFSSSSSFIFSSPSSSLESDGQSRPPQHVLVAGFSSVAFGSSPWLKLFWFKPSWAGSCS